MNVKRLKTSVDTWQRRTAPAGLVYGVIKKFGDDHAGRLAALIAYYAFFSLMPLLLVFVTILGFVLADDPDLQERLVDSALSQYPVLGDQIERNVSSIEGNGFALVVGIAVTLWAGLGAMSAAEQAMNAVWDVPARSRPNFFVSKARALATLAVLGGGVLLTTAISSLSQALDLVAGVDVVGILASYVLSIVVIIASFELLTNIHAGWKTLLPGALVGGAGWVALQLLGSWIIRTRLEGASEIYGTFAVVIVLLSWLYLQAQVLLAAAEVNVVVHERLWPRALDQDNPTDADLRVLERYAREVAQRGEHEIEIVVK